MSLGFSLECNQKLRITQNLSQSLKIAHRLSSAIITPHGICPECNYDLNEKQISQGWNDDPLDYTTKCPQCNTRFVSQLVITHENDVQQEFEYLCLDQLYHALNSVRRGKKNILGITYLHKNHEYLLWNMVKHFGTYEKALVYMNKRYRERKS